MKKLPTATIELRGGKWMIRTGRDPWREVVRDDIKKREWIGSYVDPKELPR